MPAPAHANLAGTDLHESKRLKQPVRAATTANISLTTPGTTIDGISLVNGDRILLKSQSTDSQNGIYTWAGSSVTLTRTSDAALASDFVYGFQVYVREGSTNGATYWFFAQPATVTVGTTSITFAEIGSASTALTDPTTTRGDLIARGSSAIVRVAVGPVNSVLTSNGTDPSWVAAPTLGGELIATDFKPSGLSGAVAATRWVGGTTSGAPVAGTFGVGDFVIDQTAKIWVCTGAGTPGTWVQAGGGMSNPMTVNQDLIVGGASGTPTRLAVGANTQVLGIASGVVGWVNNPAGFSNPMVAIGDMIIGTTAGAPQRLANGANTQVLTITAGIPGWSNPSGGGGGITNNVASALYLARACI